MSAARGVSLFVSFNHAWRRTTGMTRACMWAEKGRPPPSREGMQILSSARWKAGGERPSGRTRGAVSRSHGATYGVLDSFHTSIRLYTHVRCMRLL